jgi:acetyltransferase-like isoleucine patch superfamily enzyme
MNDRFNNWKPPLFDDDGWAYPWFDWKREHPYGWRCQNHKNLNLGTRVDVGCFSYLNASVGIDIGDETQIGSHCSIYSVNTENNTSGKVIIGKNVLIGSFSLILPNVIIKDNEKIKARSIIGVKSDGKQFRQ